MLPRSFGRPYYRYVRLLSHEMFIIVLVRVYISRLLLLSILAASTIASQGYGIGSSSFIRHEEIPSHGIQYVRKKHKYPILPGWRSCVGLVAGSS